MEIINHKLLLGSVSIENLVHKYGSPLFVYETDTVRRRFRELKEAIKYPKLQIYYACKANTNLALLQFLRKEGACVDCVSPGEVHAALKAGFSSFHVLFTGDGASDEEMRFCVDRNIRFNIGSLSHLRRYGERWRGTEVMLRVNPEVGGGHHPHCVTGGPQSKFGIWHGDLEEARRIASEYRLTVKGVQAHAGSGIMESDVFVDLVDAVLEAAAGFPDVETVDFGGGFGVPYRPGEERLSLAHVGETLTKKFQIMSDRFKRPLTLAIEPGRYLVAEAGYLLARVTTLKSTPSFDFAIVDSGFNHLVRPMAYGSWHEIINASNPEGEPKPYVVAGNLCETGDVFTPGEGGPATRLVPEIREGDILGFCNAGAYGYSMASNYNARPRPAEVFVEGDRDRLVRRRETIEELLQTQVY